MSLPELCSILLRKRLYMVSYIGFQLITKKKKIIIYNIDREKKIEDSCI